MGLLKDDIKEHIEASHELFRDRWSSLRRLLREFWPLVLFLAIALGTGIWLAKPAPPNHVTMTTGPDGSSFEVFGRQYAEFFRRHGITLETIPSSGSEANIARLLDRKDAVQVAFVQGGLLKPEQAKGLLSLGSISYQPFWIFHRGPRDQGAMGLEALRAQKFNIGPPGSGTNALARHILRLNGIPVGTNILQMTLLEGVDALQRGEIDGLILVDNLDGPGVQTLLHNPSLSLVNSPRAPAYTKQLDFIEAVQLPMGSIDLAKNMPPADVQLIATTVSLLIDENLHPAIQMLLMQAAAMVNGRESFFSQAKEFPSYKDPTVPESEIAQHYYKSGPPFLMRYLPFWLAEFIDRMFFMLMPMFAFAYPIIGSMPNFRRQRTLKRLQQHYGKLKFLESEIFNHYDPSQRDDYFQRLGTLEREVISLQVPPSFAEKYFELRSNIDFVRKQLIRFDAEKTITASQYSDN